MMACGCSGVLLGVGAAVAALAAAGAIYWPHMYFNQLTKMLVLTNSSMSYPLWVETPIPMYLEIFLWNMTNSDAILAGRENKPRFAQMGPYVFREKHVKTNLTWNEHNGTVTFHNNRTWFFEPDMSNGTLDDKVTNVNVVVASAAYIMRLRSWMLRPIVNAVLLSLHEHIFLTATAKEWIFDGIEDPVIRWAIDNNIPIGIPTDRFGWFYERNGSETYDGTFNMETGSMNVSRLGNVAAWNHAARTSFYRGSCGAVRGSTGELWPPELGQDELDIFASDLCTYLTLRRDTMVSHHGVEGVRYVAADSVFDNGHKHPEAACYCDAPLTSECVPPGALNVSTCRYGAPAFVSFPHFYNADPSYIAKVDGLSPSKEEHAFYMGLELMTGMPLEVRAQLQINILMRHVTGMSIANVLPDDTMVPMFWFRQEVLITPEYAKQARLALVVRAAVQYTLYALVGVGLLLLGAGTFVLVRRLLASDSPRLLADDTAAGTSTPTAPNTS